MKNTRIYKLLRSLDRKILNRFLKFVNSPYFNVNKDIITLTTLVSSHIKNNNSEQIADKQSIWKDVLSMDEAYNDLKFRKLCNDILEKFERFLTVEQLEKRNLMQVNLLLASIKEHKFDMLIDKQKKKSYRYLDRALEQSSDYFLQKYFFHRNLQGLTSNYDKKVAKQYPFSKEFYDNLSTNLEAFYIIEKLRHATDVLTWRKLYTIDYEVDVSEIRKRIVTSGIQDVPAVQIYELMYLLMADKADAGDYETLKSYADKEIDNFAKNEQREILDAMLSYVIRDINKGDKTALHEVLELYDWGIEKDIILENGFLSPTTFRNYVIGGLRISEFKKVETFISENAKLLKDSQRENAVNFCLARVAFHLKRYEDVLVYLNKVNYDDIWYNVNARYYTLASYYELDEDDALASALASFLAFLRREKSIDSGRKIKQVSFAKYLSKLTTSKHSKAKLLKLQDAIKEDNKVFNKSWLLEKLSDLI